MQELVTGRVVPAEVASWYHVTSSRITTRYDRQSNMTIISIDTDSLPQLPAVKRINRHYALRLGDYSYSPLLIAVSDGKTSVYLSEAMYIYLATTERAFSAELLHDLHTEALQYLASENLL